MKRIVSIVLVIMVVVGTGMAFAQDLGESFGLLGEGIARAAKTFGMEIADASQEMFESVKDAVEENGPYIADGVGVWVDETTPKVSGFFSNLWESIKTAVN